MAAGARESFATQAGFCRKLGSPFTAALCDALHDCLDRSTRTGERVLDWSGDPVTDALPLRLTGALHALVRRGRLPSLAALYPPAPLSDSLRKAVESAIRETDAEILPWLDSAPQTNEVGRSAGLYAGLLEAVAAVSLPVALFELGASAGLNLRLDDYAYTLGGKHFGRAESAVGLAPQWKGAPPPDGAVRITSRRGVDLNPLDVTDAATREKLIAYVWPDQAERLARLSAALAAAAEDPPTLDRGDAADWVERHVATTPGILTVVQHSIAFSYFPAESQQRIAAHLARLGQTASKDAPLGWLRFEFDAMDRPPTLRLRLWPKGEDRLLALVHPHGTTIDWQG